MRLRRVKFNLRKLLQSMLLTALTAVVLAKYIFFINQTMNSMPAVSLLAV